MYDHIILILSILVALGLVVFVVLFLLFLDEVEDNLVKNIQRASLAVFGGLLHASGSVSDNHLEMLLLADDVEEVLVLEHVQDDGRAVQVVLLSLLWGQLRNQRFNGLLLLGVDSGLEFGLVVGVDLGEELVQDFGD